MFPWDDVIPREDIDAFPGADQRLETPLSAGRRPALVIVDMTRDFVDSRYPLGWSPTGTAAVDATVPLLAAARENDVPVFFTKGYADAQRRAVDDAASRWKYALDPGVAHDLPPGDVIVKTLAPVDGEVVIHKGSKASAFFGTPLISMLIARGVDTTVVAGMTTSGCVRATALDAFQYGFHVLVPFEACADRSQISHKVSLFDLHMKYADVATVDAVLRCLRGESETSAGSAG